MAIRFAGKGGVLDEIKGISRVEKLALPLLALLNFMVAVSFGMFFSAVNVRFRDIKYTIGFLLQTWMFASPVVLK